MCKVCSIEFDDGRKLGGHVSRAHKPLKKQETPGKGKKRGIRGKGRRRYEDDSDFQEGIDEVKF